MKGPFEKLKLQTYQDLTIYLWQTFQRVSSYCGRIGSIFYLYLDQSIKQGERMRRSKGEVIETTILSIKEALPVELGKFWGSSSNKM